MVNRWDTLIDAHTLDIEEMQNKIDTFRLQGIDKLMELKVEQLRAYSEKFEA